MKMTDPVIPIIKHQPVTVESILQKFVDEDDDLSFYGVLSCVKGGDSSTYIGLRVSDIRGLYGPDSPFSDSINFVFVDDMELNPGYNFRCCSVTAHLEVCSQSLEYNMNYMVKMSGGKVQEIALPLSSLYKRETRLMTGRVFRKYLLKFVSHLNIPNRFVYRGKKYYEYRLVNNFDNIEDAQRSLERADDFCNEGEELVLVYNHYPFYDKQKPGVNYYEIYLKIFRGEFVPVYCK